LISSIGRRAQHHELRPVEDDALAGRELCDDANQLPIVGALELLDSIEIHQRAMAKRL
jgi:hypothetical protein